MKTEKRVKPGVRSENQVHINTESKTNNEQGKALVGDVIRKDSHNTAEKQAENPKKPDES